MIRGVVFLTLFVRNSKTGKLEGALLRPTRFRIMQRGPAIGYMFRSDEKNHQLKTS